MIGHTHNLTAGSVLILGASGQVGHNLALAAERRELDWQGTFCAHPQPGLHPLDVRDARMVRESVRAVRPELVLVPAAASHVDRCEREPWDAYRVNVQALNHVVEAANEVLATVVYFSTDYVFDGEDGPYDEHAPLGPLSVYGWQKLAAERLVRQRARDALIVRTTVVYGEEPQGKNFICRLLAALRRGEPVAAASDQTSTPTYAPALAEAVFDLLSRDARGVVNVAGPSVVARDVFAREAARAFGEDPDLVRSVPTSELGQAAPRPLRAGLRSDLAARCVGWRLPDHVEGLRRLADAGHLVAHP